MKKLYRFQYFTNEAPLLHQVRDLTIVMELIEILMAKGYSYVDAFLNHPFSTDKETIPFKFDISDLMVMPTRPPLSDRKHFHKRYIYKTGHILEDAMFSQVRKCFRTLSRQKLKLQTNLIAKLTHEFHNRGEMGIYVNQTDKNESAAYNTIYDDDLGKQISWSKISKIRYSCAFFMFFPAEGLLPKMLYVFGMGGQEGLMFARMLKNGLWDDLNVELDGPARFIMVEFPIDAIPEKPTSLEFVDAVQEKCRVILDVEI